MEWRNQVAVALRDFDLAFVRNGSSATETVEATPCMSASVRKRPN